MYKKLYQFWSHMKSKCTNKNDISYKNYGAKGIKVYEDWNKYENFMKWAIQNGWEETKYINRINIYKDFEPSNCLIETKRKYNSINIRNKGRKRLRVIWGSMINRCNSINNKAYKYYGGRGIKVCDEWLNSFESFEKWAQQNGYNDNLTLDRIDVNGNYESNNCRWATQEVQQNNRRNNHYIEYNGEQYTIAQLARKFNIHEATLRCRLFVFPYWDLESALSVPTKSNT